jgi:hypothetical protein
MYSVYVLRTRGRMNFHFPIECGKYESLKKINSKRVKQRISTRSFCYFFIKIKLSFLHRKGAPVDSIFISRCPSTHFYLHVNTHGISWLLMVPLIFSFYNHLVFWKIVFTGLKFKWTFLQYFLDISWHWKIPGHFQAWKINLSFSRFSKARGNPAGHWDNTLKTRATYT